MTVQEAIRDIQRLSSLCKHSGDCMACNICYKAVPMAIECMEKQIPKKPIAEKPTDKIWGEHWSCPMCGWNVGVDDIKQDYCSKCGKKIDWGAEDEND